MTNQKTRVEVQKVSTAKGGATKKRTVVNWNDREKEIAAAREKICRSCKHNEGVTKFLVNCGLCGCSGISLGKSLASRCSLGKWGSIGDPDMPHEIERVYVINMERRTDRMSEFYQQLSDWPFREPERFNAIDGRFVKPPPWWGAGAGAWGCYRSHLSIIEKCVNERVKSVLILEDDILLCEDFSNRVRDYMTKLPVDWEMAYLGGQHLHIGIKSPEPVNDLVTIPHNVNRTHAYMLRDKGISKMYAHLNKTILWAKNRSMHIDHWMGKLHESREINVFTPAQWLIGQRGGMSNIWGRQTKPRFFNENTQ